MSFWKQTRISLLALTFVTGLLVTIKVILVPSLDKPKTNAFAFPEAVPLPQWQLSLSEPLKKPDGEHPELVAQKHYRYIENNLPLDIEMRYLENLYNADVNLLVKQYTSIKSSAKIVRQSSEVGYYGLGIDQQRAYLSACVNPRGGSTFTHAQFRNNRYSKDVRFERLLPLLKGEEPLLDKRCLWVHMSMPVKNSSPETAYKTLENIWFSWYKWWQPRFPKI